MSLNKKKLAINILGLLLLVLSVPAATFLVQNAPSWLSRATSTNANIVIDTQATQGAVPQSWRALAQGGEEATPYTLSPVVNEITALQPKYIRIDHIYDFYNFDELDVLVRDILKTGALPFFSLSYMPPSLSKDGNIVSVPAKWDEWKLLVQKTVERYSGRDGFDLTGVYYEVWNEPDLFGRFTIASGEKDYLTLYALAARGAIDAQNTNKFYFGGPATTQALPNWFNTLANYCESNNLPLDFLSWHFYGKDINKLVASINIADQTLVNFPQRPIQKVISEWGIDSENNPVYDNFISATYTLAALKNIGSRADLLFLFEIKDGKPPAGGSGSPYWGRWGLITHETAGKITKPRYEALRLLTKLSGSSLSVLGAGTFVDGVASKDNEVVKLLVYNYDLYNQHYETTPVTFTNLAKGIYKLTVSFLQTKTPLEETKEVTDGSFSKEIILPPNEIALIELTRQSSLFSFTQGRQADPNDQSLELVSDREIPSFSLTEADLINKTSSLSFWFKPYWSGNDDVLNYSFFTIAGAGGQTLFAKAAKVGFTNQLVFGLALAGTEQEDSLLTIPLRDWMVNSWHQLTFEYGQGKLSLAVDGEKQEKTINIELLPQNELKFGAAQGAIDELQLMNGENVVLQKNFNGNIE